MSSISNESTRVAGLISGLNTEDLVKAATTGTKKQINTRKQKLQTLTWKQESYRDVITKIDDFKKKYLQIDSTTSIKANAIMKKCTAASSNEKVVNATASAGATPATYTIKEAKAAAAATVSTNGRAAEGGIKLDFSSAKSGKNYSVTMNLDGAEKTVVFTGGANEAETKQNFLAAANLTFDDVKNDSQSFVMDGDWLRFNGDDGIYHTFEAGICSEGLGLSSTAYSRINKSTKLEDIGFTQELSGGNYNININGVEFSFSGSTTVSEMMTEINNSDAGVTMTFSNVGQSFELKTKDTGAGQEINLYQTSGNLLNAVFNIGIDGLSTTEADSAKITYDIYGYHEEKLSSVVTKKLESGFASGGSEGHYYLELKLTDIDGNERSASLELDLASQLPAKTDGNTYESDDINTAFQTAFNNALRDKGITGTDLSVTYTNGTLKIASDGGNYKIEIGDNDLTLDVGGNNVKPENADGNYALSQSMGGSVVNRMTFIADGEEVTVDAVFNPDAGICIQDLVDKGLFTIRSDGTLVANKEISAVEGDPSATLLNNIYGKTTLKPTTTNDHLTAYGSNATLTVSTDGKNFTTYTSANNVFTFDGTNINLSGANNFVAETEDDYITIDTEKDTSGIKDVLKGFVEDYNKLLDDLYGVYNTSRPKSDGSYYDPLTEEQEEEMEEKEIEKWNENAKTGLLYRDNNIAKFLTEIRGVMAKGCNGMTLKDMGINMTDDWTDNGKLEIDEAKMESAIASNGDKIADFFTNATDGLATRLENVVDRATSTKTKNYGYLTSLAGKEGTKTDTDNQIYKQMKTIQDIIDALTEKYEKEQERYWKKYTQLETYMNNMQNQSSSIFGESSY